MTVPVSRYGKEGKIRKKKKNASGGGGKRTKQARLKLEHFNVFRCVRNDIVSARSIGRCELENHCRRMQAWGQNRSPPINAPKNQNM